MISRYGGDTIRGMLPLKYLWLRHHGSILVFNCTFIFVDGWKDTRLRRCSYPCLPFLKTEKHGPTGSCGQSLDNSSNEIPTARQDTLICNSGEEEGQEVMDDLENDN